MQMIDLNVDLGESYGRWQLGDDAALMPLISSASVACGFHAGDPATMRRTVAAAVANGVEIGAHVGLPDQLGFGRRRMDVDPDDLCDYALYQIGALQAFVSAAGATLAHVKPHGALYAMCSASGELAAAVARATAQVDSSLPLLLLNDRSRSAVEAEGVRLVTEGFPDLEYEPDGRLVIESVKSASDPVWVAQRAISLAQGGAITARDGTWLTVGGPTLCLHGDAPNAVAVAQAVRTALADAGIQVAPLRVLIDQAGDNR